MSRDRPELRRLGSSFVSLHLDADAASRCVTRAEGKAPILTLDAGQTHVSITAAGETVTRGHVEFAYTLLATVNDYLIECERIMFARQDAAEQIPFTDVGGDVDDAGEGMPRAA